MWKVPQKPLATEVVSSHGYSCTANFAMDKMQKQTLKSEEI
jgi:hypothetical protein